MVDDAHDTLRDGARIFIFGVGFYGLGVGYKYWSSLVPGYFSLGKGRELAVYMKRSPVLMGVGSLVLGI
jgi:hypothetical protein